MELTKDVVVGARFVGEELTFEEVEEITMLRQGVVRLEEAEAELIEDELETKVWVSLEFRVMCIEVE